MVQVDPTTSDRSALTARFERCWEHLERRARRLIPPALRMKLGASDLVQEAFVDAARKAAEMPQAGSDELRAWLYRIMVLNLAERRRQFLGTARADTLREVRLEETPGAGVGEGGDSLRDRLEASGPSPVADAQASERAGRLAEAVAGLPEVERTVVLWRHWEQLDYAEIGRRLGGRSADAARMVHARACRRLSETLGDDLP
jgi:RNA polymerase sigma-70 factor (ECF subfamily)